MILKLLLPALEKIIHAALKIDKSASEKIASLKNQAIKINCADWKCVFYIFINNGELQFLDHYSDEINTTITGTLNNFLHIFIKGANTTTLFTYPIDIYGNTHTIDVLRDAFKNLDLDLEEKLSYYVGDTIAHKAFFHVKETSRILKNTHEKLTDQVKEYIHCEAKNLISKKQAEKFYADVATLRDDVERMEATISTFRAHK